MTQRPLTLMAVHAHPDDEATGTGGILAQYAAQGIRTVLVTCTDGRCGDGPGGVKPGEPGHHPDDVVAMRQAELEASAAVLGVTDLELLGYADSGMMGWATNAAPHAFWNTPVDAAAARLAALMRHYRPDVVVTYDENGFYGHPDHIQAHRVTMAAVHSTGIPAKVYWTTAPRSQMAEFEQLMRDLAAEQGLQERALEGEQPVPEIMGLPDDEITTWADTTAYGGQKFDAVSAHASQGDNLFFLSLGRDRFVQMMGVETFLRVQDRTGAPLPESDLFAGLR